MLEKELGAHTYMIQGRPEIVRDSIGECLKVTVQVGKMFISHHKFLTCLQQLVILLNCIFIDRKQEVKDLFSLRVDGIFLSVEHNLKDQVTGALIP